MRNRSNPVEFSAPAAPACWQCEAPSACLRVELQSGEMHLFAYQHFVTASFNRNDAGTETARIVFSTRALTVEGSGLRELILSLQDFAVKWLRAAPGRYESLTGAADGSIRAIRIETVE